MFAIPGVIGLLLCVFVRPQEVHPILASIPLIYIFFLLALAGWAIDVRLGWNQPRYSPILPWATLFWGWSLLSAAVMARWTLGGLAVATAIIFIVYVSVTFSVQTIRGFQVLAVAVLLFIAVVMAVGVHQGMQPLTCVRIDVDDLAATDVACTTTEQCQDHFGEKHYLCEHVGLLGTSSIGGRVRYRGIVQDPNELALVASLGLPLAFALVELRATLARVLLAVLYLLAGATCTVMTKSRSGLMAFVTVLVVYGLRRFGLKGAVPAGLLAIPLLMLGGRGGGEAEESSNLRLGYWSAAIQMARDNPLFGVGMRQFEEHQPQTAHSSYMLALGERGLPGLVVWTACIWLAFRIALAVLRRERAPEALPARAWASAVLAGLSAFVVSAFFLSLTDSYILWIYLALAGALYVSVRLHDPQFRVRLGPWDLAGLLGFNTALIVFLHVYTRSKGF